MAYICNSLVGRDAGAKIVAEYRENEKIAVHHDGDSRQREMRGCPLTLTALIAPDCARNSKLVALRHFLRLNTA